jgi:hypothetical protein
VCLDAQGLCVPTQRLFIKMNGSIELFIE